MTIKKKLHTYDIQYIIMALLFADLGTLTKEDRERLVDSFSELNNMCNSGNDFTLTVTVEG